MKKIKKIKLVIIPPRKLPSKTLGTGGTSPSKEIIVVAGPTASGKSDLAIKIAKKVGGEIISADSRQVYCGMDIGTGKIRRDRIFPSLKPKALNLKQDFYSKGIKHHLIDIMDPKKQFTADDFVKLGRKAMDKIIKHGKTPIIVGGTGFYIDALLGMIKLANVPPNKKLRAKLEKQSAEQLFKRLSKLDSKRAKTIDRHNKRRLVRAIEIAIGSKLKAVSYKPKSYNLKPRAHNITWIGINPGKEKLALNIRGRLEQRLKQGMIKEVQRLHKQGVSWKKLESFGLEYRWTSRWLINKLRITDYGFKESNLNSQFVIRNSEFKDSDEYQNLLRDIIKYSKRQMTWFKKNQEIYWIKEPKKFRFNLL